jgi:hypothetical protein
MMNEINLLNFEAKLFCFVLLALPTSKARILLVFRFIIEYSSLRDFGPY